MRVAILVYGRLDKALCNYRYIKNSIGSLEKIETIDFFCSSDNSSNIEEFIIKYKPKDYINDKIDIDENELEYYNMYRVPGEVSVKNVLKHFTNKKRVYHIFNQYRKENNLHYDVVVSLRIDIKIFKKFMINKPNHNTIYIPNCEDHRNGINDQIAYGDQIVMEKYCNIIDNCKFILNNKLSKIGFHPENLTLANIKLNELTIERFNLKYKITR